MQILNRQQQQRQRFRGLGKLLLRLFRITRPKPKHPKLPCIVTGILLFIFVAMALVFRNGNSAEKIAFQYVLVPIFSGEFFFYAIHLFWDWRNSNKQDSNNTGIKKNEQIQQALNGALPRRLAYPELEEMTHGFKEQIGSGGFSAVFLGRLPDNGARVAVKLFHESESESENESFDAEVAAVSSVSHRNVVRLLGICCDGPHRALVYEYMENGSLDTWLFSSVDRCHALDWKTRYSIAVDVASAVAYLHEALAGTSIVHLDLTPHNILLDQDFHAKVGDLGLSKTLRTDTESRIMVSHVAGTAGYMAPELLLGGGITPKSDVFSFGVILLELVCGKSCMYMQVTDPDAHRDMKSSFRDSMLIPPSQVLRRPISGPTMMTQSSVLPTQSSSSGGSIVIPLSGVLDRPRDAPSSMLSRSSSSSVGSMLIPPSEVLLKPEYAQSSVLSRSSSEGSMLNLPSQVLGRPKDALTSVLSKSSSRGSMLIPSSSVPGKPKDTLTAGVLSMSSLGDSMLIPPSRVPGRPRDALSSVLSRSPSSSSSSRGSMLIPPNGVPERPEDVPTSSMLIPPSQEVLGMPVHEQNCMTTPGNVLPGVVYLPLHIAWMVQGHGEGSRSVAEVIDQHCLGLVIDEAEKVVKLALQCVQADPTLRPAMSTVLRILEGDHNNNNNEEDPTTPLSVGDPPLPIFFLSADNNV